jgi:hypothetical protein
VKRLGLLAVPAATLVLGACAAAPSASPRSASAAATASAPAAGSASAAASAASAAAQTDVPEKPEAAEAKLLARIEQLSAEPELIQRLGGPVRPQVAPRAFDLRELPVVHVAPPLALTDPPLGLLGKSQLAAEIVLTPLGPPSGSQRMQTIGFKEKTFGEILVGDWQVRGQSFNRTRVNPSYVACGTVYPRYQPARWSTLRRAEEGRVELTVSDGWLDASECKVWVERQVSVRAPAILPGNVLYAFRDCKGAEVGKPACPGEESLTLILPSSESLVASGVGGEVRGQNSAFAMASIPLRKGGGGSIFARLDVAGQNTWRDGFLEPRVTPRAGAAAADDAVGLGVEVVQGVDDPEPIAIAYVARPSALPDAISGL